jgi:aspartate/tyrosine/aromatic aminotransferase
MFESVQTAPSDPILGLTEAFNTDTRSDKINLSVGVYKDSEGRTPVLACVKEAERRILETETSKGYKPISGDPEYGRLVRQLLFGTGSELVTGGRGQTAHTPGGTGALRVAGDYIHNQHPRATLWLSQPTWANHPKVFEAAGIPQRQYPYFHAHKNQLDLDGMLGALSNAAAGDVVLLHACCHNPTGVDPNAEQWDQIARVLAKRGALPLVDFAYQGFGTGLEEDATGLRTLCGKLDELLVCSSFSKNFGLYNERTGALTIVAKSAANASSVMSQVKICVRTNYSNPPAHGGAIVREILSDETLKEQWQAELSGMRLRIHTMRERFAEMLTNKGAKGDFSFITRQNGMFSFSGLSQEQVERLRTDHGIYVVGSGRINVAGMTDSNLDRLTDAVIAVQ